MNTSIVRQRSRPLLVTQGARLVAAGLLCVSAMEIQGAGNPCEPEIARAVPSAGEWKGFFRLSYKMGFPGVSPPLVVPIKYEGELKFALGRPQEPAPPPPPAEKIRRPLRPPASTPSTDQWLAEMDAQAAHVNAAVAAAIATAENDYRGLYVPPGKRARLYGFTDVDMGGGFTFAGGGTRVDADVATRRPASVEIEGEEDTYTGKFEEIRLTSSDDALAFQGRATAVGPDGRANVDSGFGPSGGSGSYSGESSRGRVDGHFKLGKPATSLPDGVDQTTARPNDEFNEAFDRLFGPPKPKITAFTLRVEATDCWLMRGTVDTKELVAAIEAQGATITVIESEWIATLDERDTEFEARVAAFVAEPVPSPMTWDFLDRFRPRWLALLKEGTSDYRRCVLRELKLQFIRVNVSALETLATNVPKEKYGANCTVFFAAIQRILPLIRALQLMGVDDCPVADMAWSNLSAEAQLLVKRYLQGTPTRKEWECMIALRNSPYIDLGEQAAALDAVLEVLLTQQAQNREWLETKPQ